MLSPSLEREGLDLLRGLAQHLAVYDLSRVDHDLLKELYENLVDRETKHDLGEVYTPDWLVELTLHEADFRKGQSLLDPACGSGTFLFTAIRLLMEQGLRGHALVDETLEKIVGVDVHPLAVTITKVNYVLALAHDLEGYGKPVTLPVYMADSLQAVQPTTAGELVSIWAEGSQHFNIPAAMAEDPSSLDRVIDEMRRYATGPEDTALKGFLSYLESQGFRAYASFWRTNLRLMRKLQQEGRDTIWAFILKNYYRPAYLRLHLFDLVTGNPPWLRYSSITDPGYQRQMKDLVFNYGLLGRREVRLFTAMEEATVFFALSAHAYLKRDGVIALVMPRSVLTGAKQHQRFQDMLQGHLVPTLSLEKVLDAEEVSPLFQVPACVLIARRGGNGGKVVKCTLKGTLPKKNLSWREAKGELKLRRKRLDADKLFPPPPVPSPYLRQIKEGATLVPRSLWFVQPVPSPYGLNRERPALETDPEVARAAKKPWQDVNLQGEVEAQYLYATLLSRQLLPFGFTDLSLVVLPLEPFRAGPRLVRKEAAPAKSSPGLYAWLTQAEAFWEERKKERSPRDVYSRLDYQRLLTSQHLEGYYTLLYCADAKYLAAFVLEPQAELHAGGIQPEGFVAQHKTFLYQSEVADEVHYLSAFLNSPYVDHAIKGRQARGAWGERAISRLPFEVVPIPRFAPDTQAHQRLAAVSRECHDKVARMSLKGKAIGRLRTGVRQALKAELQEIDALVKQVLLVSPS